MKKDTQYCRINKYVALKIVCNGWISPSAQIMGKGIEKLAIWSELTLDNFDQVKDNPSVQEFRLRQRYTGPVDQDSIITE